MRTRTLLGAIALVASASVLVAQEAKRAESESSPPSLLGMSREVTESELAKFSAAIEPLLSAKTPRTWHESQERQDQVAEVLEAIEPLMPSKLEQWQSRDELIELVFSVDTETAHYLYDVVRAALERRDEARKENNALRARIEAGRRALTDRANGG